MGIRGSGPEWGVKRHLSPRTRAASPTDTIDTCPWYLYVGYGPVLQDHVSRGHQPRPRRWATRPHRPTPPNGSHSDPSGIAPHVRMTYVDDTATIFPDVHGHALYAWRVGWITTRAIAARGSVNGVILACFRATLSDPFVGALVRATNDDVCCAIDVVRTHIHQ